MSAVDAVSEKFNGIDPSVFNALRQAISSAYDVVKELVNIGYELGDDILSLIYDGLNNIVAVLGSFTGEATKASEQVSFLTRVGQGLSITFGAISDVIFALRLVVMTLTGVFYDLGVVINGVLSTITFPFGDLSDQFAANAEKMRLKAKGFYDEVDQLALSHQSQAKMRLDQAVESEAEKNARILEENKKALDGLLLIQEQEGQNNEKLQSRKLKAVTDYVTQAVQANDGVINSTLQLELAQKGYFATVDEGGKVVVTRLTEAQQATAAATLETKKQEQSFKNAIETGQALGVDVEQVTNKISTGFSDSSGKIKAFIEQLKGAGITGAESYDLIYQASLKLLSQAKNTAEIDEFKKKLMEMGVAGQITGQQLNEGLKLADAAARDLNPSLNDAREAGKALGIDIDKTANIMSQGFGQGSANLDTLKQKLEEAGITGKEASNTLYQGWQAWLEKADSQVEIDAAKSKLKEFESQGVFSTRQVENGMLALDIQTGKVKETTDEVTEAFKRLGIQTKDQLALQAKQALMDFDTVRNSGQATQADLQKAYQKTIDLAYASGDASVIAAANSKAASLGLQVQIDESGKASVKSMNELSSSVENVGRTASGSAAQGFRQLGRVAKQEAEEVAETWEQAMARIDKQRKAQTAETAKGLSQLADGQSQMAQDFYNQLIAGGMEQGRAEALKREAMVKMGNQLRDALNGGTAQGRIDAMTGRNASKDWMDNILKLQSKSGSVSASAPKTPSTPNIKAPTIQQPAMPNIDTGSPKTVTYKIEFGGKSLELVGDPNQQNLMNDFLSELEQLNRAR